MRYLLFIFMVVLSVLSINSNAQTLDEAISFGSNHQDFASQIAKAPNGDIYVVGGSTNITDFNPLGLQHNIQAPGVDKSNAYISKYNSDMTLDWVKSFGQSGWDDARQLLLDDSLNIYIMGYGEGVIDFNPSANVDSLDLSYGGYFVAKYGNDGAFKAVAPVTDIYPSEIGDRLQKDDHGNIYAYSGVFLSKYTSDLNLLWTQEIGGTPMVFNNLNMYCIRNFKSFEYVPTPDNEQEIVLEIYNLTFGTALSEHVLAHTDGVINSGFVKKTKNNDLLIYGKYWGTLAFYGGGDTLEVENYTLNAAGISYELKEFICRYDQFGNLLWAKAFDDKGPNPNILETDEDGHIYALGQLHYSANFDPVNPVIHTAVSQFSAYIAKYDSAFNYLSMSQFLGANSNIHDFKLYADTALICGSFYAPIDVDLTPSEQWLETNGFYDAFMIKYSDFDIVGHPISINEHPIKEELFNLYIQSGHMQIHIIETLNTSVNTISVYDINGRQLISVQSNYNQIELDLSAYPDAVYIVQVANNIWSTSRKIVKHSK